MLILSRKVGEVVCIGADVRIRVTSAGHGKVRLGIEAPADVKVLRAELVPGRGKGGPGGPAPQPPPRPNEKGGTP
jgi:carbon storage regulator